MPRSAAWLFIVAMIACSGPAAVSAADPGGETTKQEPKELLEDAARSLYRAIELMISAIPQYQAPEVLENGDIIIRRKRKETDKPEAPLLPKQPGAKEL